MDINYGHIIDIKFINFWTNVKKSMILKVQFFQVLRKITKVQGGPKLACLTETT